MTGRPPYDAAVSAPADDERERVERIVRPVRPRGIGSVEPIGAGLDHTAYLVDGELIVRFDADQDPVARAERVRTEARVLRVAASAAPPAVPQPRVVDESEGALVYDRIAGTPLIGLAGSSPAGRSAAWAATIGRFLHRLHRIPSASLDGVRHEDQIPDEWLVEARDSYPAAAEHVPDALRGPIETFLAADPPPGSDRAVFCHNDLGIEHVLVDPGTSAITGVIDWGDAAVTDPARDLALVYRDLGPAALAVVADQVDADDPMLARARFYARCSVFEDMIYGLEPGNDVYLAKSVASLAWLFAAGVL